MFDSRSSIIAPLSFLWIMAVFCLLRGSKFGSKQGLFWGLYEEVRREIQK